MQSLRFLVRTSKAREAAMYGERNQLQACVHAKIDQILLLEQDIKPLQEIVNQLNRKIQDVQESEARGAYCWTTPAKMEGKLQILPGTSGEGGETRLVLSAEELPKITEHLRRKMVSWEIQLAEYVTAVRAEGQNHLQEIEVLKESLIKTEKHIVVVKLEA